jgi:hypothetical protein
MNRLAVWVAQTAVGATVPKALAQATASPLPEIEAGARLDPDIAAQPLVAMDMILSLEGMARGAKIQRAKIQRARSASASNALTVHPVTAANDSRICDKNGSVPMPNPPGIDTSSWAWAVGPSRAAEGGSQA